MDHFLSRFSRDRESRQCLRWKPSQPLRQFCWKAVTTVGRGPIMAINFFHLPLQSTIIIILPILNIGIHAIIIIIWYLCSAATSGKICSHWTEFKENVDTAFGNFREDNALSDLTLACKDGFQIEAHKVILAASSSFFQSLLLGIKNPHPKWCLRGLQSKDLVATVEFLYSGESNILGENLKYFLAIAKEFQKRYFLIRIRKI